MLLVLCVVGGRVGSPLAAEGVDYILFGPGHILTDLYNILFGPYNILFGPVDILIHAWPVLRYRCHAWVSTGNEGRIDGLA